MTWTRKFELLQSLVEQKLGGDLRWEDHGKKHKLDHEGAIMWFYITTGTIQIQGTIVPNSISLFPRIYPTGREGDGKQALESIKLEMSNSSESAHILSASQQLAQVSQRHVEDLRSSQSTIQDLVSSNRTLVHRMDQFLTYQTSMNDQLKNELQQRRAAIQQLGDAVQKLVHERK